MRVHLLELIDHHVSSSTDVTARFGGMQTRANNEESR
jgi:hypothetical protein